jgi:hypothetical protein
VEFEFSRLRRGEWIIGVASLVLIASTFLKWYGLRSAFVPAYSTLGLGNGSRDAWSALTVGGPLILITGVLGLAAWYAQGACRAPALPVCLTVMLWPVSLILSLYLINRVLISKPGATSAVSLKPGAIIGLLSAIAVFVGAYVSMRQDGIRTADGPQQIETFRRGSRAAGAR